MPPRTPAEQTLAEVWERVLGLERVGAHDNFFELGGDSLLALHAVSRAVKAGLPLTLRQLFLQPTLSELAQHTASTPALAAEQELVTGPVPLVPSQHRFFYERRSPNPHHWNHALLLATARLDPGHLEITVGEILRHHDALRLRFTATDAGWQQRNAGETKGLPFLFTDLSKRPERERVAEMEWLVVGLQGSLNLTEGPLLRVAYFNLGALGGRLFVTMHHLVLDPISWRIFWEDFATVYRQVSCGERPAFPAKTSSFKAWAEALETHARTEGSREGLREWLALPWDRVRPLPLDVDAERFKDNLNGSFGVVIASLSQAETERFNSFLDRSRYRAKEVLVAVLAQTFPTWTGCSVLHFDMVGLNRGALLENLDLSRTLGYFVTYLPALIDLAGAATPNEVMEAVAAQLRHILPLAARHELLRYLSGDRELIARLAALPRAEVLLNYRGAQEHDESFLDTDLWRPAAESRGPSHSPQGLRHHPFNIAGDVIQGRLTFTFTYSKKLHQPATVEMLATTFTEAVRRAVLLDDKGPPTAADRNAALTAYEGG